MIELRFTGTAEEVRADMAALLGGVSAPAVSGVSNDTGPKEGVATPASAGEPQAANKTGRRGKARAVDAAPAPAQDDTYNVLKNSGTPSMADAETKAQDAADEKADTEAARNPEKPLTVEDVKAAVKGYVEKHTMAVAGLDLQFVWYMASSGKVWKMSQMNAELGQPMLKSLVDAVNAATAAAERPKVAIDAQAKYGKDADGKPVSSQVIFEAWMAAQKAA